jgi:hypothetical protein
MPLTPYAGERGKTEGPGWLADGLARKKAKNCAAATSMHILLYANFNASELEYEDVRKALIRFSSDFASVWVVTSLHLCSVFAAPGLGEVRGWGPYAASRATIFELLSVSRKAAVFSSWLVIRQVFPREIRGGYRAVAEGCPRSVPSFARFQGREPNPILPGR